MITLILSPSNIFSNLYNKGPILKSEKDHLFEIENTPI